ncbi:spore coat U domain-containing protein [Pseudohalocynthiibacter aestuariivivens]|nr:spore coat U domain-containing protein [Pseudohalocynthiibacter aestuariivivens]
MSALDFGVIGTTINSPVDAEARLNVRCTSNTSYMVTLDNGTGPGASGPTGRVMRNGARTLVYGLFQNAARSMPWGDQPGNSMSGVGQGNNQVFRIYGRIFASQSAGFGVYQDSVVVTVHY